MSKKAASTTLLGVEELRTGYGSKEVLHGVSIKVPKGEIVAILGHNGAGKSTLLKAVFGMLPSWSGRILFRGEEIQRERPSAIAVSGVCFLPQGNRVFDHLTVRQNLALWAGTAVSREERVQRIEHALEAVEHKDTGQHTLCRRLKELAGDLSGGQKQLLSFACALTQRPRLLLLDEPSLGLAPNLVDRTLEVVARLSRETGLSVLIVEQKVRKALRIADSAYVLRQGAVALEGRAADLLESDELGRVFLS